MSKPPDKPAALFIAAVEQNYSFNTGWPEFSKYKHGVLSEDERAAIPTGTDALEWAVFMNRFRSWVLYDLPSDARAALGRALEAGDWSVIREIIPDCTDTQPSASNMTRLTT